MVSVAGQGLPLWKEGETGTGRGVGWGECACRYVVYVKNVCYCGSLYPTAEGIRDFCSFLSVSKDAKLLSRSGGL